jgi:hypothetical protein
LIGVAEVDVILGDVQRHLQCKLELAGAHTLAIGILLPPCLDDFDYIGERHGIACPSNVIVGLIV